MPFTPFHLGPALLMSLLLFTHLDFVSFMVSGVVVDVEPLCIVVFRLHIPFHSFFHTYLGATILGTLTAVGVYLLRSWLSRVLEWFKIKQRSSFKKILYTSLFGVYFHIFLDSFLYAEMEPFYPLTGNPFLGVIGLGAIYEFCTISFILGSILYIYKFIVRKAN